ncbi:MAG: sugar phosphate isomerase/epimerase family protein [Bilophila wadsworthia]
MLPSFKASAIRNKDDLRETARCLRLACALAKHRGIAVATENLLDVTMMKSLLNIVAYDNLCSCLDLSHFVLRGREDVFEALPEHLAVCCGVHLKDGMYGEPGVRPLGEGSCRAGELLAALKRKGTMGRCSSKTVIRSRFSADALYALRRDAEYVRQAFL